MEYLAADAVTEPACDTECRIGKHQSDLSERGQSRF
jgi:hypothetical protein